MMDATKYHVGYYPPPVEPGHVYEWPQKDHIEKAPAWCSVDLRDGNQSLIVPMNLEEKLEFYDMLIRIGFKEIEVGFPAASETEYDFLRALIDGNRMPPLDIPGETIVKGDACSANIAAASILAKVSRDRLMLELDKLYPEYQFAKHKGYGTKLHRELLQQYGPCPIHRRSFLKKILGESL